MSKELIAYKLGKKPSQIEWESITMMGGNPCEPSESPSIDGSW